MADGSRTSSLAGTQGNALLRWLMPSVADLIFVAVLSVLVFTPLSMKLLSDAGTGWHIRTGQLVLATHAIPRVDPFSSQIQKPWIAWEWLYDVIIGFLERTAGLNGVVWFTAVVIAGTFAAMFRLLMRQRTDLAIAVVLTLLAISASMIHFLARPHVLSWLFALVWYWILETNESSAHWSRRRLWILPLLMIFWANVHGAFLLGFVLLAAYWLGAAWSWLRLKESRIEDAFEKVAAGRRLRDLTSVGFVTALASCVNPYGWKLHEHIYFYLTNRFFMDHVEEFQSPNFHRIAQRCFLVLLLMAIAVFAARGGRLKLSHILLALFAVYGALYASRNIPVSAILLVLIFGPQIPALGLTRFTQRMGGLDLSLRGHGWPIAAAVVTLLIALNGGHVGGEQAMNTQFDPQRMPVEAVNFIEASGVTGPVLAPDYWGGYLIYRLNQRNKVVIDDRHDFYGEEMLRSYLKMMRVEPGWEEFLKGRSCIVLPRNAALTALLDRMPEWRAVHSDHEAVVFLRKGNTTDIDRVPGD